MSVEKCYDILQLMQASNSNISESFAERLRWFRNSRGIGQAELGKLVDRKASTISDWEKGKTEPSLSEIKILADGLAVSPSRLAFGEMPQADVVSAPESADPKDVTMRSFVRVLQAAGDDAGRLGWIREQIVLHLGPPKHWLNQSANDAEAEGRLRAEIAERKAEISAKQNQNKSA